MPTSPSRGRRAERGRRQLVALALALFTWLLLAATQEGGDARADSPPATSARGLDVFVSGPTAAAAGATLTYAVRVVGYRTVLEATPVEGATVDLSWDPTTTANPPPPVRATTDASGRAAATVTMPAKGEARLFITVKHGARARTRTLDIGRKQPIELDVVVHDTEVVPGTRVGAWVRVRDRVQGRRLGGVRLVAEVLDGGVTRGRTRAVTDATGSALVFLQVPELADGAEVKWSLRASLEDGSSHAEIALEPREEVPGKASLAVAWDAEVIEVGGVARARVRLRDASGDPLARQPVDTVVRPLRDDDDGEPDWEASTRSVTDGDGQLVVDWPIPPALPGGEAQVRIWARTTTDRALETHATFLATARSGASFTALPEAGVLVPGIPQRLLLRAHGDDGKPLVGRVRATGDGLAVDVDLDARGEGEIAWTPPVDVGSRREVGSCARTVAASVTLEDPGGRLARRGGRSFACVVVDRTRDAILVVEPTLATAGQKVRVRLVPRVRGAAKRPVAVALAPADGELGTTRATWIEDGEAGGEVELPPGPAGVWAVGAFAPRDDGPALGATAAILVAPARMPQVKARVIGGRIAPSGEVEIEARLTAGPAGTPVDGLVAAMAFDAFGGSTSRWLERLDTRARLCEAAGLTIARCPDVWERTGEGPAALVRSGLSTLRRVDFRVQPVVDPARAAREELDRAFAETLKSLEGAVFESTESPERLIDARRDGPRGRTFNPELLRIVTDALATPPTTPGGEPLQLADLVAIDPQVRFDVVARRVTRLKVFRVLEKVRDHRNSNDLDLDEPALADPDALLARLTTSHQLAPSALLDPWGGTLAFRRARGAGGAPPIASLPGWELASPGPDGRRGTGDDVVDPFERVLQSGTPYARAVDEDAIVLARGDIRIKDATVAAWSSLLEEKTGTTLGNREGSGQGRLGGSHRTRAPTLRMGATSVDRRPMEAAWALPTRTRDGVVRLRLPLGSVDTTYRIVVIGLPDGGEPAVTLIDIPIATPIAARIEAGDRWVEGDEVEVAARIRNRTGDQASLTAEVTVRGDAAIARGAVARQLIAVPARGAATLHARVRALRPGEGTVEVVLRDAAGKPVDAVRTTVPIAVAGRPTQLSRSRWVAGDTTIPALQLGEGDRAMGAPRLVVEGGVVESLAAALRALEPDRLATPDALVEAVEASSRAAVHAKQAGARELAAAAAGVLDRARGRLAARKLDPRSAAVRRVQLFAELPGVERAAPPCDAGAPPAPEGTPSRRGTDVEQAIDRALSLLEAEPSAEAGSTSSCWEGVASDAADDVGRRGDPLSIARLVLAFAERPHRAPQARLFALRLAKLVELQPSGRVALPATIGERRDARALVLAALTRAAAAGARLPASRDALLGWLLVQRDATGGFGSPLATRAAVAAMVTAGPTRTVATQEVTVTELDEDDDPLGPPRTVRLGASAPTGSGTLAIDPRAAAVRVAAPGALVRLERTVAVRSAPAAELLAAPLQLGVDWPDRPRAGGTGVVEITARSTRPRDARAFVRLPLPAGVSLAEKVEGVRAVPGALLVDLLAEADDTPLPRRIPVRFALPGTIACPEASAVLADEAVAPAYARAPPLTVRR